MNMEAKIIPFDTICGYDIGTIGNMNIIKIKRIPLSKRLVLWETSTEIYLYLSKKGVKQTCT